MLYLLLAVLVVSIPLLAVQTLLASITVFEYERAASASCAAGFVMSSSPDATGT